MKTIHLFLLWTCTLFGTENLWSAPDPRADLTGQVLAADGAPVTNASVFVYSAEPKQGSSVFCPYCYVDCQKKTQTDAAGRFTLESLDSTLMFRLLVVANGYSSQIVSKVDPAANLKPITLKSLTEAEMNSDLRIKGMIVGDDGKPLPQAVINVSGVGMGQMSRWGGSDAYVEPLAVADDQGQFILFCKTNVVDQVFTTAEGRGVAKQWVTLKPAGDYLVRMRTGVTVTGQLTRAGRPVAGVSVGTATTERAAGKFFNGIGATTDSNGHFQILNVPPYREFVLFTEMKSLHGDGALPNQIFTTGDSGTTQDLGELAVEPAFKIAGHIVLSDGKPIPAGTKLLLNREKASDNTQAILASDGTFEFTGVPAESISLSVRIKGYRFAKNNPSLDWLNGRILGLVTGDMTNLDFLMEPGPRRTDQDSDRPSGADEYPIDKPLASATP